MGPNISGTACHVSFGSYPASALKKALCRTSSKWGYEQLLVSTFHPAGLDTRPNNLKFNFGGDMNKYQPKLGFATFLLSSYFFITIYSAKKRHLSENCNLKAHKSEEISTFIVSLPFLLTLSNIEKTVVV